MEAAAASPPREWWRFVSRLVLVLSPLLVAGAGLEALAWRIGETMPMALVSRWQDAEPGRIWRGGDGHSYLTYKLARVRDLRPDIVALGPSRANAFRGAPLAPYSFYNAGLTAWTFDQYRRFLELAGEDGYAPRALIFNLDYWMFSAGFDHYWVNRFDEQPSTHVADLLRVGSELRDEPARLWRRLPTAGEAHGLFAVLTGDGFAADGAMVAPPPTADPQRLAGDGTGVGVPPVVLSDDIATEQTASFMRFAAFAKEKGVALIGVQLPYYARILDGLDSSPDAGIWRAFRSAAFRQRIAEAGVIFFDFADVPEYRDRPEYFTDSLDPDASAVAALTRRIAADPRVRAVLPQLASPGGR
ncbi:MAG TPA: hypothetical protein VMB84_07830 [Stellaceae bacterium]|nr:hypothetical protein [Stellaceae bacterium]